MVGWIIKSRTNSGIQVKIYSIILLYFKEKWITMISTKLQKVELGHNKEQDTTAFNKRSHWQIKESNISTSWT